MAAKHPVRVTVRLSYTVADHLNLIARKVNESPAEVARWLITAGLLSQSNLLNRRCQIATDPENSALVV